MSKIDVKIFYSSTTDPDLSLHFSDGMSYIEELEDVEIELIDISQDPEKAREFGINATVTVLVVKDGEIHKEFGIVSYFKGGSGMDDVIDLIGKLIVEE